MPMDGFRLRDLCSHARVIWTRFQQVGHAPSTWGRTDAETVQVYHRKMCTKFPELGLCENDWKADQLATENYPFWFSNHVKGIEIKSEQGMTDSALQVGSK